MAFSSVYSFLGGGGVRGPQSVFLCLPVLPFPLNLLVFVFI